MIDPVRLDGRMLDNLGANPTMMNATKLADLIERGRHGDPTTAAQRLAPSPATSIPPGAEGDPVTDKLERLAVELFSISKTPADPRQRIQEALRSIEKCLVSIKRQN